MTFPLDDILLGPRTFGRLHRLDGVIWHTGEEPAFTRAYAVATANWQRTNPGSYNFRVYDRRSDPRGVMLNVPYLEASGGINPMSAAWAPDRFPFLRTNLPTTCPVAGCGGPYRNPTMHHLQVSFVGTTAALNAGQAPPNYVPDARGLIEWAERHPLRGPRPLVHSKHGHWQSNRSDCGDWMYSRLDPRQEISMPDLPYFKPNTGAVRAGAPFRDAPNGAEVGELSGGPIVILAELPAGAPRWFQVFVGARSKDGTRDLGTNVPDVIAWVARADVAVDASPINLPFVQRVGKAVYTNEPIGLDATSQTLKAELIAANAALDSANTRTATVKTEGAKSLRAAAQAERDHSASLEAAATNLDSL